MSGLRHRIPAALQPGGGTCGRAGEIPGIAGIAAPAAAPSPPPCPPPNRHEHSGPHPRAPTAGLSPPHSTALLRAPSALRCPARPPHASPGADVPRPHPRQPRGGGRLSGPGVAAVSPGPVCSPPPQRAPQRHPGVSVPTSPGEIGARRRGPHIPVVSSPPPQGSPCCARGLPWSRPLPPPSQGQLSVSRQAEPGSSCRAQQSGGGALLSNHPLEPGEVGPGAAHTHRTLPGQPEPDTPRHSTGSTVRAPSPHAWPHLGLCSPWGGGSALPMHISSRVAPDTGLTPPTPCTPSPLVLSAWEGDWGVREGGGGGVCLPQAECRMGPSIVPAAQTGKGQAAFAGADSTPRNASAPGRLPTYLVFCTGVS